MARIEISPVDGLFGRFAHRFSRQRAGRGSAAAPEASKRRGAAPVFEPFVRQWAVLLTTYRRDGAPVGTPVNLVVEGDRAFFRTWETAWKFRRIRNNPKVEIRPSTPRGTPTGPAVRARARVLGGDESERASRALARKHPFLHGLLVPLLHRMLDYRTVYLELTPIERRED